MWTINQLLRKTVSATSLSTRATGKTRRSLGGGGAGEGEGRVQEEEEEAMDWDATELGLWGETWELFTSTWCKGRLVESMDNWSNKWRKRISPWGYAYSRSWDASRDVSGICLLTNTWSKGRLMKSMDNFNNKWGTRISPWGQAYRGFWSVRRHVSVTCFYTWDLLDKGRLMKLMNS